MRVRTRTCNMKRTQILLLLFIACGYYSCRKEPDIPLGSFKNVIISGNANATLVTGSSNELIKTSGITVATAVVGNSLIVSGSGNATIAVNAVDTIFFNGAATLNCTQMLQANRLVIECNGDSMAKMDNLNISDTLFLHVNGKGTYQFSGIAKYLKAYANGSGYVSGYGLTTNSCHVEIVGPGKTEVYSTYSVQGIINGDGNVYYKGNPLFVFPVYISGKGQFIKQ